MRQLLSVICLIALLSPPAFCQAQTKGLKAQPNAAVEQELRDLERAWLDAYDNNDAAAMKRILADNFTITYENGAVLDKKQTLANLRPGAPKDPNARQYTEDSVVRVYGNAAVITGRYINKRRDGDKEIVRESRYTDTYLKRQGRWQVVASHLTTNLVK